MKLGDKVEKIIKKTAPSFTEKRKGCTGCERRKEWLNNVGAIFSNEKHISKNGTDNTK